MNAGLNGFLDHEDGWIFLLVCLFVIAPFTFACARKIGFGPVTSGLFGILGGPFMLLILGAIAAFGVGASAWLRRHL